MTLGSAARAGQAQDAPGFLLEEVGVQERLGADAVEADAAVTGNVIENAPSFGIMAGWGKYLRDVTITGNVVRNAFVGIGVSVVPGAGTALVSNNLISGSRGSAIVGLDHAKPATGDLGKESISRFPQIVLGLNAIR